MSVANSRGFKLDYQVSGEGLPLILVCGHSQWADQWVAAGYVDALQKQFRVIRIDPLGHGKSDKPHDPNAYLWASVIDDLLAVADTESVDTALWWGFSRGAALVQDLAFLHPSRVNGCVLGSNTETFGAGEWPSEPVPELLRTEGGMRRIWSAVGFAEPGEVTVAMRNNDREALACIVEGTGDRPDYDRYTEPVPVLSYRGSRETYSDSMQAFLDNARADQAEVVAANHYQAFARCGEVLAFVQPFLANVANDLSC